MFSDYVSPPCRVNQLCPLSIEWLGARNAVGAPSANHSPGREGSSSAGGWSDLGSYGRLWWPRDHEVVADDRFPGHGSSVRPPCWI